MNVPRTATAWQILRESIFSRADSDRAEVTAASDSNDFLKAKLLPAPVFLELLRRDQLRAVRERSPLSLLRVKLAAGHHRDHVEIARICGMLSEHMRETDILGYLDDGAVTLSMPETTEDGAHSLVARLAESPDWSNLKTEVVTYPDDLFARLRDAAENCEQHVPVMFVVPIRNRPIQAFVKRLLDIVGAIVAIVAFSPVMLATALAIKVSSPGPIIFKQRRVGKNLEQFEFYKFRSMRAEADDRVHRTQVARLIREKAQLGERDGDAKPVYKMTADDRITKVGRWIRKTSIDELPQLFNVLKNEMSLVGPRPPLSYEVELYEPWHLRRVLHLKPGITGLWQVEGRSEVSFEEMVRLDLRYGQKASLLTDLRILFKTVSVVLRCKGSM